MCRQMRGVLPAALGAGHLAVGNFFVRALNRIPSLIDGWLGVRDLTAACPLLTAIAALMEDTRARSRWNHFTDVGTLLTFHGRTVERLARRWRRMPSAWDLFASSRRDCGSFGRVQEHGAGRPAPGAKGWLD